MLLPWGKKRGGLWVGLRTTGWGGLGGERGGGGSQSADLQNDFICAGERPSIFHDKGITMMKDVLLSVGILHHLPPLDQLSLSRFLRAASSVMNSLIAAARRLPREDFFFPRPASLRTPGRHCLGPYRPARRRKLKRAEV